jgi:hypothetical protein
MGKYGLYTVGNGITSAVENSVSDVTNGDRFRFTWKQVETSDGVYNFSSVKASTDVSYNKGKYIWLQFLVSPCKDGTTPAYNCPAFLFSAPYNVPKVFTSTSGTTLFYPHYVNANFVSKQKDFLTALFAWIASLPPAYRAKIVLVLSSEGKTGDPGPYNGTPTNPAYVITDAAWNTHKYDLWLHQVNAITANGLTDCHFMINPGNDGENLQYGIDHFTGCNFKCGDNSHNYDFAGSKNLSLRYNGFRDPTSFGDFLQITGGEFENTDEGTPYTQNPKGYLLPFFCFNLAAGTSIITIAPAKMITDRFAYQVFNEFADFRNYYEADKGLLLFRDKPDFNDTVRFPESTYGPVIDPARLSGPGGYTQKYNGYINSGKPAQVIADNITDLRISFINPARITAVVAAVPGANYITLTSDRDYDATNSDFGFDVIKGNFSRYLDMYDPDGTSVGAWRVGYSGFDGRYCRKLTTAKGKWYFSTPLMAAANYQMVIKVRYYNAGAGQFALYYHNGTTKVNAGTVATTNTDAYIEKVYPIADMQGGTQLTIPGSSSKADFTIEKISGDDIYFSMMRIYVIAVNAAPTNIPPVADAGVDQTHASPLPFFTLDGSGSTDADGTVDFYNWIQTAGPPCVIENFTHQITNVTGIGGGNVAPGTYKYTLKVLDNDNAQGIDTITIVVNPEVIVDPQPPVAVISGPLTGNINEVISLSGASSYDNDGTVDQYLWSVDGPIDYTVDSTTNAALNITGKYPGTYNITLLVTDNDGLTDEKIWQLVLTDPTIVENTRGGLPGKKFQYYLINQNGLSYYLENGVIKTSSVPKPLDLTPDGWQQLLIQWERNTKYYGINRNVSNQLAFVGDGSKIIRYIFYNGTVSSTLYLLIQKLSLDIDEDTFGFVYRFLYKGQIDLTTFQQLDLQQGRKVQANIAEGDFSKFLSAYENQVYEIDCSANAKNAVPIWNDGVQYYNKLNYALPDIFEDGSMLPIRELLYALPVIFLNQEGDSFNLATGSQTMDIVDGTTPDYAARNSNWHITTSKTVDIIFTATFKYVNPEDIDRRIYHYWLLPDNSKYYFKNNYLLAAGQTLIEDVNITYTLQAGQSLTMLFQAIATDLHTHDSKVWVSATNMSYQLQTRLDPSLHYGRRLADVLQETVDNMTGSTYTTSSTLFEQ